MFKTNLNQIHYTLSEKYENITVNEKADNKFGDHIEMVIENEDGLQCKAILTKKDLDNQNFKWFYFSNPEEMSQDVMIERVSSVFEFTKDINDIFENKRFSSDYLQKDND